MEEVIIQTSRNSFKVKLDKVADRCPSCNRGTETHFLFGYCNNLNDETTIFFRCNFNDCLSLIKTYYKEDLDDFSNTILAFEDYDVPFKDQVEIPKEIRNISPEFIDIYTESYAAFQFNLLKISGAGFRKSFEYLIKDFLIHHEGIDPKLIDSSPLSQCIDNHIQNEKIKDISKRTAWLGNDHVHYKKVWNEKDINHLLKLIEIVMHFISYEIHAKQILKEMPNPNNKTS